MSGKATATEIEQNWTYRELLECIWFMDQELVATHNRVESNRPENKTSTSNALFLS